MPIQLPAFPLNGTARLCQLLLPLALCAVPASNFAAALNDTGITFCAGAAADAAATSTANNAVTAAATTKATAFTALATAAAKLNTDVATAAASAASAKTAAATALTSATTAQTTAATATTAGVAMPATATTTAQAIYTSAESSHNVANANATTIVGFTSSLASVTGIAYTAAATATAANAAVPTAVQVAKDAATVNSAKATQANTDAAKSNATANTAVIAIAGILPTVCTTTGTVTTCAAPALPTPVMDAKSAIEVAATSAAAAADAAETSRTASDTAAFTAANVTALAAAKAALAASFVATAYPTVTASFNTSKTDSKTAADSTALAALSAKAATAAAIASTDATAAATAANTASATANNVMVDISNYNDAKKTYDDAVVAYNVALAAANAPVDTAAAAAAKAAADAANCVTISSDSGTYPRQDARYGRDAETTANTLPKMGGGRAGFDFTRIANNGASLPAAPTTFPITTPSAASLGTAATDWACTKDNVTGLVWEIKTTTLPRSMDLTYTWYNSTAATNGGSAGTANGGDCLVSGRCDTEKYIADVNTTVLCGFTDWRLPTVKELESIVDFSGANAAAAVDASYFPNTPQGNTWASSSLANYSSFAWSVYFKEGNSNFGAKSSKYAVRLVRGGQ